MADRCSFCGSTAGPFSKKDGLFTVLMCADCQAARGRGTGPYPVMTRAEMRAGLDLLPTWALEQKAAANRQLIAAMRLRLAAGEQVARTYQKPGLAWLERQAEVAEDLVAERQAAGSATADVDMAHDGRCPVRISATTHRDLRAHWCFPGSASGLILHLTCLLSIAQLYEETPSGRWLEIPRVKASCLQPV